jgi:hypothetical protein
VCLLGAIMMGLRQQTQRKPAMVIVTTMVRVTVPVRRPQATEAESLPLLAAADPDQEPRRDRLGLAY